VTGHPDAGWPHVDARDWCGEYERRPECEPCFRCGGPVGNCFLVDPAIRDDIGIASAPRVCKECFEKSSPNPVKSGVTILTKDQARESGWKV
jgi:hypothetical protein